MKRVMILVLGLAGIVAQGQEEGAYPDNFKKQISRTPFMVWEWADADSVRAYQDSIDGMMKFFYKDFGDETLEYFSFFYDVDAVYDGSVTKQMINDWKSLDFDSMYYHDFLDEYSVGSADSFKSDVRGLYGAMWNEPYQLDSQAVTFENAMLELDTLNDGTLIFHMSYLKVVEDTLLPRRNQALYDHLEIDESEMFGVLMNYDFSGQWLGRVYNVTYDLNSLDVLSSYTLDSMLIAEFEDQGGGLIRDLKPVEVFNHGALSGTWDTQFRADEDSAMVVYANYYDPNWSDTAHLIWTDRDTLRYIIEVKEPALVEMGAELKEGQGFAWYWDFSRINGIKEDEERD